MDFSTIKVNEDKNIMYVQIYRPNNKNTINRKLVEELTYVVEYCDKSTITILILKGLPDIFCFGADLTEVNKSNGEGNGKNLSSQLLYELWTKMQTGSFVCIAMVQGKTNAGGIGFIASSDIVIASIGATFSLSELLFGIYPACVLPFLIKKIGYQNAHYMTLMTKQVTSEVAYKWGLVDEYSENLNQLLARYLMRLKYLPKDGISNYKKYMFGLSDIIQKNKDYAITNNLEMFRNPDVINRIKHFNEQGEFTT